MELNPSSGTETIDESHPQFSIIKTFIELTSCPSISLAMLFLEYHHFELEAAVSYFFDHANVNIDAFQAQTSDSSLGLSPQYQPRSPPEYRYSPSEFPPLDSVRDFRSGPRSPSTLSLRPCGSMSSGQRRVGDKVRARDFNGDWDTDPGFNNLEGDANDLGRRVRARGQSNEHDGNEIFDRERQSFAEILKSKQGLHPLSSTSFMGTSGLLSEEFSSALQQSEAAYLFQSPLSSAPTPPSSQGLIVDQSHPSTLIQIRLFDGTRVIQQFNHSHTIRDVRAFLDSLSGGGPRGYHLQTMDFPPRQLTDPEQTIDESGIAYSVLIQRL